MSLTLYISSSLFMPCDSSARSHLSLWQGLCVIRASFILRTCKRTNLSWSHEGGSRLVLLLTAFPVGPQGPVPGYSVPVMSWNTDSSNLHLCSSLPEGEGDHLMLSLSRDGNTPCLHLAFFTVYFNVPFSLSLLRGILKIHPHHGLSIFHWVLLNVT